MSDSEVPQQNTRDNRERVFPSVPPMPPRWDDPPTSLSEQDLMRMAPGGDCDEILDAVSDALWEPVELNESRLARAERLKEITERGERLRERWAETAALEEAYAAPPTTLHQRQGKARTDKHALIESHMRRRRRSRIVGMGATACTAVMVSVLWFSVLLGGDVNHTRFVSVIAGVLTMSVAALTTSMVRLFGDETGVRVIMPHRKNREQRGSEEAPVTTPE
ncbi:hypothetical protein [Streptomyces avermitilis]|uniref:hypothetical protein n=1 Tax=Streptomyces avermitilis TaxID=33903 RepID=UPI0033F65531